MAEERRKRGTYDPAKRRAAYLRAKQRARAAGFTSPSQQQRIMSRVRVDPLFLKRWRLSKHNVSEALFEQMRRDNLAHTPEGYRKDGMPLTALAKQIQAYNTEVDAEEDNFSDERIGYIVSYYWAVANPKTNYFAVGNKWTQSQLMDPKAVSWRERQYNYLVRYGGLSTQGEIMNAEDFEERYGTGGPISQDLISMYKL